MQDIPKPTNAISEKAISIWRIQDSILYSIIMLILGTLLFFAFTYHWFLWIRVILSVITGFIMLQALVQLSVQPILLQKTWKYSVNKDFIDIQHGYFHTYHTTIPVSHIKYVHTIDGPLLRKFGLVKLIIGTMTSTIMIPHLLQSEAKKVKEKIVSVAKLDEQYEMNEQHE
ncbi:MAG TPA: PH domain-containing protein [Virgibacillus sp.]|nr:PH domain-containing protein [Virgibacillus sp.]